MLVSELGKVIDGKGVLSKAELPILVIELGRSIDVKELQPEKVPVPILVIELGKVIDVKDVQ